MFQKEQAMEIPVLIELVENNGFRARSGEPLALCAEGSSPAEALANLQRMMDNRLQGGARLTFIAPTGGTDNAWTRMAGIFENEPFFDAWQEAIKEYRRQVEEDPERI